MRWTIKSIEWSAAVSKISGDVLPYVTHAVLPDLPSTVPQVRSKFRSIVPRSSRIETAAINQMDRDSYLSKVLAIGSYSDNALVVGGNKKHGENPLSTPAAIEMMRRSPPNSPSVWAVLDPNCPYSIEDAYRKYEAGASRFITQPVLSSRGFEALQCYPQQTQDDEALVYVAGVAFPKTLKGLLFWESLLSPNCDLEKDSLFRDHCEYFASADADSTAWVERQIALLAASTGNVDGLHFMPLQNVNSAMKVISRV